MARAADWQLVVYKVDRLSRSLLDFARLIGIFEERGVSLVSVTQQMNTTGSSGAADTEYPVVVCAIRAGADRRADAGQDAGRAKERQMAGRQPGPVI